MTTIVNPVGVSTRTANRRLAAGFVLVVGASLCFVAVQPRLYKAFCEWTGLYDIDRADKVTSSTIAARPVRVEFDANTHDSGLRFKPELAVLSSNTGDIINMSYRIENTRNTTVVGQAVPSYGPQHAGQFVKKLDCFCFKQQTFAPHEVRDLPVVFFLDKGLPEEVTTVTLSYTFFEVPVGQVSGPTPSPAGVKS